MDFKAYYENQIGSGLPVFKGSKSQKGMGLGNVFRSFARWVVPLFKTHALPAIKSGAQTLGAEAVKSVAHLATDAISGKNIEESAKERTKEAINELSSKVQKTIQSGSGYKRRVTFAPVSSSKSQNKKRRVQDIFD